MKTLITAVFIVLTTGLIAQPAEEAAIKKVCLTDTQAFMKRDFETWKTTWHHVDHATMLATGPGLNAHGWEAIEAGMKSYYQDNPTPSTDILSNANYVFDIQGDHAYVHYEQAMTSPYTVGGKANVSKTYEMRNMIKVDGEWKIYHQVTSPMVHENSKSNVIYHLASAGGILRDMDRIKDGAKIPQLAAEIFPNIPSGYWGMGVYALWQKDKAHAIKHFKKAMSMFDGEAPQNLKNLYEQAKELE